MTEKRTSIEPGSQRTIGASILALLTSQVGLLALFLSGSSYLQASVSAQAPAWGGKGLMMLLMGITYLVLAYGLWSQHRWSRVFSILKFSSIISAALVYALDANPVELDFVLVFFMCMSINLAIIAWFYASAHRD
jgi:uncharacterized membrane protein (DUF2068 family)